MSSRIDAAFCMRQQDRSVAISNGFQHLTRNFVDVTNPSARGRAPGTFAVIETHNQVAFLASHCNEIGGFPGAMVVEEDLEAWSAKQVPLKPVVDRQSVTLTRRAEFQRGIASGPIDRDGISFA